MDGGEADQGWTDPDYVENIKKSIAAWRAKEPGVVSHLLGIAAAPLVWVARRLIPQAAIEGALSGLDWCAKYSLGSRSALDANNLVECDRNADRVINLHISAAALEGGIAGFAGIIALPLDIPAIILLALRTIRQIGVGYGYSDNTEEERQFVLSVLSASGANTQVEKAEALAMAALLMNTLSKQTWKAMAAKAATQHISIEFAIISTKNLVKQLGINLTKRKALAAIPVIGTAVGASANGWFIREAGIAAQKLYQERWLRDRKLLIDGEATDDW